MIDHTVKRFVWSDVNGDYRGPDGEPCYAREVVDADEYDALLADRDEADEAGATNAENVVRLAGKCDSLRANIRYAAGILDKIIGECAAHADTPKPAEISYALCYIRALAGSAILDLGLAVGSQARPIFGVDMARGPDKTVIHGESSGETANPMRDPADGHAFWDPHNEGSCYSCGCGPDVHRASDPTDVQP